MKSVLCGRFRKPVRVRSVPPHRCANDAAGGVFELDLEIHVATPNHVKRFFFDVYHRVWLSEGRFRIRNEKRRWPTSVVFV